MSSFRNYALGAAVFALLATAARVVSKDLISFLMTFDSLAFIPVLFAITISGNVHAPSEFGAFLGIFFEWFIAGLVFAMIAWGAVK
jgi:hypothetical protein